MVEYLRKFESHGIKIARVNLILITKSINLLLFGRGVRCDRLRFSVHSPYIEKSMVECNQKLIKTSRSTGARLLSALMMASLVCE